MNVLKIQTTNDCNEKKKRTLSNGSLMLKYVNILDQRMYFEGDDNAAVK